MGFAAICLTRTHVIKQVFREAFERNVPVLLMREGDDFLDWYGLGDLIWELALPLQ